MQQRDRDVTNLILKASRLNPELRVNKSPKGEVARLKNGSLVRTWETTATLKHCCAWRRVSSGLLTNNTSHGNQHAQTGLKLVAQRWTSGLKPCTKLTSDVLNNLQGSWTLEVRKWNKDLIICVVFTYVTRELIYATTWRSRPPRFRQCWHHVTWCRSAAAAFNMFLPTVRHVYQQQTIRSSSRADSFMNRPAHAWQR